MAKEFLTFLRLAEVVLSEARTPLTPGEIFQRATERGLVEQLRSRGKTPSATLAALLYVNVRDNPDSKFLKVGGRPARFVLRTQQEKVKASESSAVEVPAPPRANGLSERQLHPLLVYFARTQLGAHCKTIFHERARKGGFNQWLYPDIVGVTLTTMDWRPEVVDFARSQSHQPVRLYSFELKLRLDFSNLRESFFQAVSNSSWAHEGYLVASEIDEDPEFRSELQRLSESFGIGVILLDIEAPGSSDFLFRGREKSELDWETMNKLAEQNPDFRSFLQAARSAALVNKPNASEFDLFIEEPEHLLHGALAEAKKGRSPAPRS